MDIFRSLTSDWPQVIDSPSRVAALYEVTRQCPEAEIVRNLLVKISWNHVRIMLVNFLLNFI